jgi:putative tributyrin esterase
MKQSSAARVLRSVPLSFARPFDCARRAGKVKSPFIRLFRWENDCVALLHCHFKSDVLEKRCAMSVIVPDSGAGPFPVFYLLHGLSDDHTAWARQTSVERYVKDLPLIVAMPDGFRSFYTDHAQGPAYGRYMMEDVIGFVERVFPARADRAGRCIGGLSMGGYGALRLALAHPESFISANSHSGALQAGRGVREFDRQPEFLRAFGTSPAGSMHDLHALTERAQLAGALPELYIDCGTEDFLLDDNRAYAAFLKERGVAHTYREHPGEHLWDYWDRHIVEALAFHSGLLSGE